MTPDDKILAGFSDKASKDPVVVRLYQDLPYLQAYAAHTDMRVSTDPYQAIGGLWEEYGQLMRDFLVGQGLTKEHTFLDYGCGTGRLARKIVPYLRPGKYTGIDISREAIGYARGLAIEESWVRNAPRFEVGSIPPHRPAQYDFIWAFSVMIHLPTALVCELLEVARAVMHADSRFYFSYVPTKHHKRTGLKQFKHPYQFFVHECARLGLSLIFVDKWPGLQKILLARRE